MFFSAHYITVLSLVAVLNDSFKVQSVVCIFQQQCTGLETNMNVKETVQDNIFSISFIANSQDTTKPGLLLLYSVTGIPLTKSRRRPESVSHYLNLLSVMAKASNLQSSGCETCQYGDGLRIWSATIPIHPMGVARKTKGTKYAGQHYCTQEKKKTW